MSGEFFRSSEVGDGGYVSLVSPQVFGPFVGEAILLEQFFTQPSKKNLEAVQSVLVVKRSALEEVEGRSYTILAFGGRDQSELIEDIALTCLVSKGGPEAHTFKTDFTENLYGSAVLVDDSDGKGFIICTPRVNVPKWTDEKEGFPAREVPHGVATLADGGGIYISVLELVDLVEEE
jgi:hypothetical protein